MRRLGDGAADQARGLDARFQNLALVARVVTAVDAAAGQVDDSGGALQLAGPVFEIRAGPEDGAPRGGLGMAAQHHDIVAGGVKMAREHAAHLAAASRDDDFHIPSMTLFTRSTTMRRTGRRSGNPAS